MTDLCGGHPADGLIAVCLAALPLAAPGVGRWRHRLLDGLEEGAVLQRESPGRDPAAGEGGAGMSVRAFGRGSLCLVSHTERKASAR